MTKRILPYCFSLLLYFGIGINLMGQEQADIREILRAMAGEDVAKKMIEEGQNNDSIDFHIKSPQELFDSLPTPVINNKVVNRSFAPKVFGGYRKIHKTPDFMKMKPFVGTQTMTYIEPVDSIEVEDGLGEQEITDDEIIGPVEDYIQLEEEEKEITDTFDHFIVGKRPKWLNDALLSHRIQEDLMYLYMIEHPDAIEYTDWDLPEPPVLYEDDVTFLALLKKQEVPEVKTDDAVLPDLTIKKKHWLHKFSTLIQFSQAFVSPNWYQGGNSYMSLLFNFNWNVNLNTVFHPNLLFQSDLSYKLALSSTPEGSIRKYTISDDAFQYNLNTGLKAVKDWYYSLNLLFKTQLFNNFENNSHQRTASFLSPGDLNLGLGMSYSRENKLKTFKYTLTLSPLSYNLKTCIVDNNVIPHSQFNIDPDKKTKNEFGSNAELNLTWQLFANISYKTRFFVFTNYSYFLGDWQNTFSFDINKWLSTQLFLHLRWDTSADKNTSWKTFMMREILSFGLSYTFSTKP